MCSHRATEKKTLVVAILSPKTRIQETTVSHKTRPLVSQYHQTCAEQLANEFTRAPLRLHGVLCRRWMLHVLSLVQKSSFALRGDLARETREPIHDQQAHRELETVTLAIAWNSDADC